MKRKLNKHGGETGINHTPVLGLAFILLLFVILVFPFTREQGFDMLSNWRVICDCAPCEKGPIVISVDSDNRIFLEESGKPKRIGFRSVRNIVAHRLAEDPRCGVFVEAHGDSDMGTVIRVVDQAKLARDHPPVPVNVATED